MENISLLRNFEFHHSFLLKILENHLELTDHSIHRILLVEYLHLMLYLDNAYE